MADVINGIVTEIICSRSFKITVDMVKCSNRFQYGKEEVIRFADLHMIGHYAETRRLPAEALEEHLLHRSVMCFVDEFNENGEAIARVVAF